MISGVLEMVDPLKIPGVTWMDQGVCDVRWGWYGDIDDHEIVGIEPWVPKSNVYILHAVTKTRLTELARAGVWLKGEAAAKTEATVEGWKWPQNEYDTGTVSVKVDRDVSIVAGGNYLK